MAYVLSGDIGSTGEPEVFKRKWQEYAHYLESVRESLPKSAFEFATASWRHSDHHRSLHDSWVESLTLSEPSSGDRHENRAIEIQLRLMGSYHDGYMNISYRGVQSYSLETPSEFNLPPLHVGHGDWLYDEVRLSEQKFVVHEVEFSRGSRWLIECKDIDWTWEPIARMSA
jgi:hypothetical protein